MSASEGGEVIKIVVARTVAVKVVVKVVGKGDLELEGGIGRRGLRWFCGVVVVEEKWAEGENMVAMELDGYVGVALFFCVDV